MSTIYYATVQEKKTKKPPMLNIHNLKKTNKLRLYIVLVRGDIAFKDCMSSQDNMALLQSIWGKSILVLTLTLPPEDILIVNALEQRTKHS